MSKQERARRGLFVFAALTIAGSALVDVNLSRRPSWIFALMWIPGAASIVTRVVLREGFSDVSLRFEPRRWRQLGLAWAYPLVVLATAYGLAWGTGLEPLRAEIAAVAVAGSLAKSMTLGLVPSVLSAAGEELGWRGYMLPRLIEGRVPHPIFMSGIVWWAWHLPLVLGGQLALGPSPWFAALLFLPTVMSGAVFAALVRLASGSVWPAVMFHAAFNAAMDLTFDPLTSAPPGGPIWTGASGLFVGLTSVLAAAMAWRVLRDRVREESSRMGRSS